jgi:hypothetical protein
LVQEAQTGEVELPDDDPFAVSKMIEYLYHQTYTIPSKLVPEDQRSPSVPSKPATTPMRRSRQSLIVASSRRQSHLHPLQAAAAPAPPQESTPHDSIVPYGDLDIHYKVYALGEKYGIKGLKALAVHHFETEGEKEFKSSDDHSEDLINVLKKAYACTAEGDRPLRDAVVRMLKSKAKLFKREDMKKFLKEEGLAYDLAMSYMQEDQRPQSSLFGRV